MSHGDCAAVAPTEEEMLKHLESVTQIARDKTGMMLKPQLVPPVAESQPTRRKRELTDDSESGPETISKEKQYDAAWTAWKYDFFTHAVENADEKIQPHPWVVASRKPAGSDDPDLKLVVRWNGKFYHLAPGVRSLRTLNNLIIMLPAVRSHPNKIGVSGRPIQSQRPQPRCV
eukprot:2089634-Amphidinium_carterae.2